MFSQTQKSRPQLKSPQTFMSSPWGDAAFMVLKFKAHRGSTRIRRGKPLPLTACNGACRPALSRGQAHGFRRLLQGGTPAHPAARASSRGGRRPISAWTGLRPKNGRKTRKRLLAGRSPLPSGTGSLWQEIRPKPLRPGLPLLSISHSIVGLYPQTWKKSRKNRFCKEMFTNFLTRRPCRTTIKRRVHWSAFLYIFYIFRDFTLKHRK